MSAAMAAIRRAQFWPFFRAYRRVVAPRLLRSLAHAPRHADAGSGLGMHYADLDTAELATGSEVVFTFYWASEDRWEGVDHRVVIN